MLVILFIFISVETLLVIYKCRYINQLSRCLNNMVSLLLCIDGLKVLSTQYMSTLYSQGAHQTAFLVMMVYHVVSADIIPTGTVSLLRVLVSKYTAIRCINLYEQYLIVLYNYSAYLTNNRLKT